MIKIKNITIKNFLSIGNVSQAVNLERNDLTLVLGENLDQGGDNSESRNGVGKTSLLNAISYAIYGQALSNIKKGNLVNKINGKHMLVTLCFSKNNVDYRIERGRNPSVLKFFVNDQEQIAQDESQGDSRETQKAIDDIIEMSHDMFKHIVALNTYNEPFLAMKANDQRAIIEQLLGITILTEKADSLRELLKQTREAITSETHRINTIEESNRKISQSINSLKTRQKAWINKKKSDISNLELSLENLNKLDIDQEIKKHKTIEDIKGFYTEKETINKDMSRTQKEINNILSSIKKLSNEVEKLEESICYTCGQAMHNENLSSMKESKYKEIDDLKDSHHKLCEKIDEYNKKLGDIPEITDIPETFYDNLEQVYEHKNNVLSIENKINDLKTQEDPYLDQIKDLETTAIQEINWKTMNNLKVLREHQEFLLKLLTNKDSFIRKKIIDQNLNYLNGRLKSYLNDLGLPHDVKFLNDLSVEITQLGQDLDFDNLSRGERNRLILGLSFAFRDVWENIYSGINLLFIDELVDSGMDGNGVENALYVLKKMSRETKKSVFLISHRDELQGRVNNILKVVKENGFTSFDTDLMITDEF